ncbi:VOC family protein [Halobacillus sp. Marseille-Q1614]|uniref:VOC family protein n=1 Tax=Halobacillus sp. Marseille-Q1614 TaxID=2709134 RepID=UPI00156EC542|nr:VOC family protein [Halobacillus sp. Marseille-Q1614]
MSLSLSKISPSLWFDQQAEDAACFYCSVFENSKILETTRYGEAGNGPAGSVVTVSFELEGQTFVAINGGPHFSFTPAISFSVDCESQKEVDNLWEKLSKNGEIEQCGWLRDRYGVSWQIVPKVLREYLNDSDPKKVKNVTEAMLQMKKLNIDELNRAYDQ